MHLKHIVPVSLSLLAALCEVGSAVETSLMLFGTNPNWLYWIVSPVAPVTDVPTLGLKFQPTVFYKLLGTWIFYDTLNSADSSEFACSGDSRYYFSSVIPNSGSFNFAGNKGVASFRPVGNTNDIFSSTITFFSCTNFGGNAKTFSGLATSSSPSGTLVTMPKSVIVTGTTGWRVCVDAKPGIACACFQGSDGTSSFFPDLSLLAPFGPRPTIWGNVSPTEVYPETNGCASQSYTPIYVATDFGNAFSLTK